MENTFTKEFEYQGVIFRYSRSPSLRKGNEIHAHHEIIYYMDGGATLLTGGIHQALERNTLIFVPKGSFHNLQLRYQERYTRLTVSFSDLPILSDVIPLLRGIRLSAHREVIYVAESMKGLLCEEATPGKGLALYGAFLSLISALTREYSRPAQEAGEASDGVVTRCMEYIDTHFAEDIRVSELAGRYYVSESFLFSAFKSAFGISIHQYVTQRRMIHARRLLEEGKKPTEIYSQCGYADYSTFYKAYVKRFSQSPRDAKKG